jgi:hypothetical protein
MYNIAVRDCAARNAISLEAMWLLPDDASIITIEMRPRDDPLQPQLLLPPARSFPDANTDPAAATTVIPPPPPDTESHSSKTGSSGESGGSGTGGPSQMSRSSLSAVSLENGLRQGMRRFKTEVLRQQARPMQQQWHLPHRHGAFGWLKGNGANFRMGLPLGVR